MKEFAEYENIENICRGNLFTMMEALKVEEKLNRLVAWLNECSLIARRFCFENLEIFICDFLLNRNI